MNKNDLIQKIKLLDGITPDERAYLINLVNTKKKYGLVWEDKPEDVEEQLRTQLPVLKEVVEKRIIASPSPSKGGVKNQKQNLQANLFDTTDDEKITEKSNSLPLGEGWGGAAPNHILIEGDNLHALTALTFTHEGKIDVMYFDPPYNTGNKDFKYNDSFVDKEDSFRHSKWLSFMHKRLEIAKKILSKEGLIFISIDDIEYAPLKLLLDDLFTQNMVNSITIKTSESSGVKMSHVDKKLPKIKEYLLIYSLTKDVVPLNPLKLSKTDDIEKFKGYAKYYSKIIINKEELVENWVIIPLKQYFIEQKLVFDENEVLQFKIENADKIVYRTNNKSLESMVFETETALVKSPTGLDYIWWEGKQMLFLKDYIEEGLCDLWTDISTINLNKEICDLNSFENGQKPLELIKRVLRLYPNKNIKVLDFFAGSGTTLHATMQLNAEDGGNRQCILVTNNENNICEEVTYERNKRVIQGYTNSKGNWVDGLTNNNLRYYKTDFVSRQPNLKNKRELTRLATELLCIKEDCYTPNNDIITDKNIRVFENDKIVLMVIYDDTIIDKAVELIKTLIKNSEAVDLKKIKVYVFSNGQYPYTEEFEEVLEFVTLCALPDAIYKAYQNVLPKKQREIVPELEEEILPTEESTLFNQSN